MASEDLFKNNSDMNLWILLLLSDRHKSKPHMEKLLRSHVNQQRTTSTSEDIEGGVTGSASAHIPSKLSGKTSGYMWPHLPEPEITAIMEMLPPPLNTTTKNI